MKKSAPPIKVNALSNNGIYNLLLRNIHYTFNWLFNFNYDNYASLNVIILINIILSIASLAMMVGVL